MNKYYIILMLLVCFSCFGMSSSDKAHVGFSSAGYFFIQNFNYQIVEMDEHESHIVTTIEMLLICVGKETFDKHKKNPTGFSGKDLKYDSFGMLIGVGTTLLFNQYLFPSKYESLKSQNKKMRTMSKHSWGN